MRNLILLAPALLGFAVAAPSSGYSLESLGSFSVENVAHGKPRVRNPAAAITKSFSKFGMDLPEEFTTSIAANEKLAVAESSAAPATNNLASAGTSTGSVTATGEGGGDVEFLSPVTIGGQTMMMNFDTGSSDL